MRGPMPDDRRIGDALSDGALSPTVARAAAALRSAVPVRAEWRAGVMAEIERAARRDDVSFVEAGAGAPAAARRAGLARISLAWPAAIAAAVVVFAAGAVAARLAAGPRPAATTRSATTATRAPGRGTTRFVLVAPNAQHVALVGDFNLWNPESAPMRRLTGTDEWEIDLPLPAGRHAYAFVVDGDVTADPSAPRTAGDDYGRPNSVVLVSSPQS